MVENQFYSFPQPVFIFLQIIFHQTCVSVQTVQTTFSAYNLALCQHSRNPLHSLVTLPSKPAFTTTLYNPVTHFQSLLLVVSLSPSSILRNLGHKHSAATARTSLSSPNETRQRIQNSEPRVEMPALYIDQSESIGIYVYTSRVREHPAPLSRKMDESPACAAIKPESIGPRLDLVWCARARQRSFTRLR